MAGMALLAGCAITPQPLSDADKLQRITADRLTLFQNTEPVQGPLTVDQAMARAIKYNLDHRVELMSTAVSEAQLSLAHYDLLPKLAAAAGYNNRNNQLASSSTSIESGRQSLEPSTSQERGLISSQLAVSWNVLDFGVSYIRAVQASDRVLIAGEQRRKVVHNIIQDVRSSYWRAVAADRLLGRIDQLMGRAEAALVDARKLEQRRVRAPLDDLQYQRALLATIERLKALRRELVASKTQLAALMSLSPTQDFKLVVPPDDAKAYTVPPLQVRPEQLEEVALYSRPELNQLTYQERISADETRRILLELLPGVSLNAGVNYDSNRYTVNNTWANYGVGLAWNLLNVIQTPARLEVAEADQKLVQAKRAALSLAVLAQVDVSWLRYRQAIDEFQTAREQAQVERRIHDQLISAGVAQQVGELAVIQAEADDIFGQLRRDIAYANLQNAFGAVVVSVGADPLPDTVTDYQLPTLSSAISTTLQRWEDGTAIKDALERLKAANSAAAAARSDS